MRTIPLTMGKVALVDDDDFEWLSRWKWFAVKKDNSFYAGTWCPVRKNTVYMHRVILLAPKGSLTDHQDGDGLNNQRYNIRTATKRQNQRAFRTKANGKTSEFRGVSWDRTRGLWKAQITVERNKFLGRFESEVGAALAYNEAAKTHFGEFAQLNKVS